MSLLGIDVGTTGCKAGVVDADGNILALAYREYAMLRPQPGWAELDSRDVWLNVKEVVSEVGRGTRGDPIAALCVTSLGEAMTPVSASREILANCILNLDARGEEYAAWWAANPGREQVHALNGNVLGNAYSAPKLAWLRDNQPDLFARADRFLLMSGFISYLMGAEATTDPSLASRTLLYGLREADWSDELMTTFGIPRSKLPRVVPAGTVIGQMRDAIADELGLPRGAKIVAGGHDQCCTALGAGVLRPGRAVYGMGTFICVTPVYEQIPPSEAMLASGFGVEPHVLPGLFVSFLYNSTGGSVLRWVRDTLAQREKSEAQAKGYDVYDRLMAELPAAPTDLMVLPHFAPCGPPTYDARSSGVIVGLKLETTRGELIKGLLEGVTYYLKEGLDLVAQVGLQVNEFRATGGGARSDSWLQLTADILGQPIARLQVSECGVLGAAILAGAGCGVFGSAAEAAERVVRVTRWFEPAPERYAIYAARLERYKMLYPLLKEYLHGL